MKIIIGHSVLVVTRPELIVGLAIDTVTFALVVRWRIRKAKR